MKKIIFILFIFFSCSDSFDSFAVVLWNNTGNIKVGNSQGYFFKEVENIYYLKSLDKVNNFKFDNMDNIFFKIFKSNNNMKKFIKNYYKYKDLLIFSDKKNLIIRKENNDKNLNIVYKMNINEKAKIIQIVQIKDQKWYQILTKTGILGWLQNESSIDIISLDSDYNGELNKKTYYINMLSEIHWRPEYFKDAIINNEIDIDLFKPNIGLSINKNSKDLYLVLSNKKFIMNNYDIIYYKDSNFFEFKNKDNKRAILQIIDEDNIIFRFKNKDEAYSNINLIRSIPIEKIEYLYNLEIKKKQIEFLKIINTARTLSSVKSGFIEFKDNGDFQWLAIDKLKNIGLIPDYYPNYGSILLDKYIKNGEELDTKYNGTFTLLFGNKKEYAISFLYKLIDKNNIMLYFLSDLDTKGNLIISDVNSLENKLFFVIKN